MIIVRYIIIIGCAFLAGWLMNGFSKSSIVVAMQPEDCKQFGLKATGWEFQAKYKGGADKGGASSFITYECK